MFARISSGNGVDEAAIEMRVLVIGDHVQNGETHRLILQHVHARPVVSGGEEEEKGRKGVREEGGGE